MPKYPSHLQRHGLAEFQWAAYSAILFVQWLRRT